MFDSEFAAADDAAVVAAIEECARLEAIASARRLAAIAELARRMVDDDEDAAFDGWAGCAAQIGAALSIGQRRASAQMRIAIALRDRLPKVAALALKGELSARVVATITWRTSFVVDDEPVARIDAAIAERATGWGRLSDRKLDTAIDGWVARYDPEALRTLHAAVRARHFTVGHRDDATGTTSVWGRLSDIDAETLDRRVTAMVRGVCADDPRSIDERRSAAVGAIGAGEERLACACGSAACPSAAARPASNVVIHVLAEQCAVDAARTPSATREQAAAAQPPAALIVGGKVMPAAQLGAVIRGGATVRPIHVPGAQPEPRYRPSAALAQFVRLRDLFCRAPGCDVPAERCDIDHTIPYPLGPTHASNLKLLCRTDHLMKTFGGWHDVQLPDGTVIWTSPTGRRYVTKPGAALFFPHWDTTTADLPPPPDTPPPTPLRELKMPRRRRTRAAAHAAYINAQRALNRRPASF